MDTNPKSASRFSGPRMAERRQLAGLTQRELGDAVGRATGRPGPWPQTVSSWERGETAPGVDEAVAVATVLNCKIADLLDGDAAPAAGGGA
jgi:repressor LexA